MTLPSRTKARLFGTLALAVIVVAAYGSPAASPSTSATARTVVCPRLQPAADLAFGIWGGPVTLLRQREFFAAVGSWGSPRQGSFVILGSATPTSIQTDAACEPTAAPPSASQAKLSRPFVYKRAGANAYFRAANGEQLIGEPLHPRSISVLHLREPNGVRFRCRITGRVVVHVRRVAAGNELRVSHGKALLAVASMRSGTSRFRISNRCEQE